jgi:hypothetical protein
MGGGQGIRRGVINLSFRRRFGNPEVKEWEELEDCLSSVHLIDQEDDVQWALTKKWIVHSSLTVQTLCVFRCD